MNSQELCAAMRWVESARAALHRCDEAAHDHEAAALAIMLRAAIHAKTESMREHMRVRIRREHERVARPQVRLRRSDILRTPAQALWA